MPELESHEQREIIAAQPIGVFDSGVGGLSVLREIRHLLPGEDLLYAADSAHAPYGDKTKEFILERSFTIVDFFLRRKVKAIVVACNTATGAAVRELREQFSLPIIAMEPAIKPAAERTRTSVIGVMATSRTLSSRNFSILSSRFADQVRIIPVPCPGLVEQIELGDLDSRKTRTLVAQYVQPMLREKVDIIVLGCTHYPFLAPLIEEIAGPGVAVIDSGSAIARELNNRLERFGTKNAGGKGLGSVLFYSSAGSGRVRQVISQLWAEKIEIALLPESLPVN